MPSVTVRQKTGDPADASVRGSPRPCWIQAADPSQIDNPGRVYYMADSREYRPTATLLAFPTGTTNDGWYVAGSSGNLVYMGTRHGGYPNVVYMDGHAGNTGLSHPVNAWNMKYDQAADKALSEQWRCSTFSDAIPVADVGTQHHLMPMLRIVGWEAVLSPLGRQ